MPSCCDVCSCGHGSWAELKHLERGFSFERDALMRAQSRTKCRSWAYGSGLASNSDPGAVRAVTLRSARPVTGNPTKRLSCDRCKWSYAILLGAWRGPVARPGALLIRSIARAGVVQVVQGGGPTFHMDPGCACIPRAGASRERGIKLFFATTPTSSPPLYLIIVPRGSQAIYMACRTSCARPLTTSAVVLHR